MPASDTTPLVKPAPQAHWLWRDYPALLQGPAGLWLTLAVTFLFGFVFFLASIVVELYLTEEFGAGDVEAGLVYCAMGVTCTIAVVAEGSFPDKFSLRFCFLLAGALLAVAFLAMAMAPTRWIVELILLTLFPIGIGLTLSVTKVAVKRFTQASERSTAYSLLFVAISGSSAFASLAVDLVSGFTESSWTYRSLLLMGTAISLFAGLLAYFIREESVLIEGNYWETWRKVVALEQFRVLFLVVLALVFVKAGYRQLDATLPRYMRRELGHSAHFGIVMLVHPLVLLLSALFLTPLALCMQAYWLIVLGTAISAASSFILFAAGCEYWSALLYVSVMTIGEAIWNPRLYDYALSKAPVGLEGLFMAISSLPLYLSMFPAGVMASAVLSGLCPAADTHCDAVWVVVGGFTLVTPIALVVIRKQMKGNLV